MPDINYFVFLLVLGQVVADTTIYGHLFGPGVCSVHKTNLKKIPVVSMSVYNDTTYTLCWHFPPWCKVPTDHELYAFGTSLTEISHEYLLLKCCSGYRLNENGTGCVPVCSVLCKQNSCIKPNNCTQCVPGYSGPTCQKDIPRDNGTTTAPTPRCICPNENFVCNAKFKCVCADGFEGPQCNEIRPEPIVPAVPDDVEKSCSYYIFQVSAIIGLLATVGVLVFVVIKRRSNVFIPLTDEIE